MKGEKRRIIAVGNGFKTKNSRSRESARLLNWGMRSFDTIKIAKKDETFLELDVWLGKKNKVDTTVNEDIFLTIPKRKKKIVKVIAEYDGPIEAPITKGEILGTLNIYVSDKLFKQTNILSSENIKRTNIFSRLFNSLNFLVWGDV